MIFESLGDKLQDTISKLRGKGKVTEQDVDEAMREVKLALLEADVNFKVVKSFVKKVKERSLGSDVMESLTPGQQVIKIVMEELSALMGDNAEKIDFSKNPTVILMTGLQGAGKTTTTAKLARLLKKQNKRPLLVACDVYRPAAIKQLEVLASQVQVPVFDQGTDEDPVAIARRGVEHAKANGNDVVIIDTAGRLHVDEALMDEIKGIKEATAPTEILLVLDAMTGQDAVKVAQAFNDALSITGVVLTKLDGDARGGAALSIRSVTDVPIKYIALGEKLDALEVFHPDRMAKRILGMGDVVGLIEKAEELEEKIRSQTFTFDDFLDQMQQMRNLGPLEDLLGMLPGMNNKAMKNLKIDEKEFARVEAIIQSMTKKERTHPEIIDSSRKKRIAQGSGTDVRQVNGLLKQFKELRKMMKKLGAMNGGKGKRKMKMPFPF